MVRILLVALLLPALSTRAEPPLPTRPLTAEEQAAITHNVELVQKQMEPLSHLSFNFTDASIKWLDGFIERNRSHESASRLQQVLASYLGETIRVQFNCSWVGSEESIALSCPGNLMLFPFTKVAKQFSSGHDDSIYAFYQSVPTLTAQTSSTPR